MQQMTQIVIAAALLSLTFAAAAQRPIVYPAKGQSSGQQNRDDGECYVWAKQATGIDPAAVAAAPTQAAPSSGGTVARGMVGGALGGAAIGGIAGDAGEGAAIGALIGTWRGVKRTQQQEEAAAQQAQSQKQQTIDTFYRAYGACMSGRGYSIM